MSQHDRMTDAIAKYVIDDLRHLNFIESPHFIQLLVGISSNGIDMPSRDCLKKRLAVMKEEAVVMIRRALQDKQPALTCDLWTSDDDTPYLSISCRYIEEKDETCKLVSCMLSCEQLLDFPVTGEMIAEMLKMTMKKFGIEETAVSVTTGDDVDMHDAVTNHLPGQIWQACAAHRIEQAIKPVTENESIRETVALHNEVAYHVQHSPKTRQKLDKLQQEATGKKKKLPRSGVTHWGSVFNQAKVMLAHKASLEAVLASENGAPNSDSGGYMPSDDGLAYREIDWTNTEFYLGAMKGLAGAVKVLQSDQFLTNGMMPTLCAVLRPVIRARSASNTNNDDDNNNNDNGSSLPDNLKEAAEEMFNNLEGQFEESSAAEKIAAYLDVRCKRLWWARSREAATYRRETKAAAMKVCEVDARREEEEGGLPEEGGGSSHLMSAGGGGGGRSGGGAGSAGERNASARHWEAEDDNDEEEEEDDEDGDEEEVRMVGGKRKVNQAGIIFASMLKRHYSADARGQPDTPDTGPTPLERKQRAALTELDYYEAEMPLPAESSPQDVLDWWLAHKEDFPTLYKVACVYLAIPATSFATKQAFATCEEISTLKRNDLNREEVGALVFLNGCIGVGWKGGWEQGGS